jgi:hypothetical protein
LNFLVYDENFVFFFISAGYVVLAGWQVYIEPPLKGPKHKMFGSGVFMQSKPAWVGTKNKELGQKIKILMVWAELENLKFALFSVLA